MDVVELESRLSFREASPADAEALAGMNRRLIEDERHLNPMSLNQLAERLRDWLVRGEYRATLFYLEGPFEADEAKRPVPSAAIKTTAKRANDDVEPPTLPAGYALHQLRRDYYFPERVVAYVRHFYVERGLRRRGVGRLAFERIVRERFPAGATIELEVLASNPVGREFWASLGFEPRLTVFRRELRA